MALRQQLALPIDSHLSAIKDVLARGNNAVVMATPGSGKTTRVPPALLSLLEPHSKDQILVLEPRRLAARLAAERVAEEMGEPVGRTVGYQFRFEKVDSAETRVLFLTEGLLIRRLMGDPTLKRAKFVLLDEFHERSLNTDIAIGHLRRLQKTERPDLKIIVMSATLETKPLATYLDPCTVIEVTHPVFPLTQHYEALPAGEYLDHHIRKVVRQVIASPEAKDILVFLPGMGEIRKAESTLQAAKFSGVSVFALHAELDAQAQRQALGPSSQRKIILSTNVAETSLTIPGVNVVIDSGLHRQATYSWWSGIPALKTKPISKASAIQRAGRAARTGPGTCIRLYAKEDFDHRQAFELPEIHRSDLCQSLLEILILSKGDIHSFPWFESPPAASLSAGFDLLEKLGAIRTTKDLKLPSDEGHRLVKFPVHPRIARVLLKAETLGILPQAALFCAMLSEGDVQDLEAENSLRQGANRNSLSFSTKRLAEQLVNLFGEKPRPVLPPSETDLRKLGQALLAGFPDRVAEIKRRQGSTTIVLSSGGSAKVMEKERHLTSRYFLALDVQETKHHNQQTSQLTARTLYALDVEQLLEVEPSPLTEVSQATWDSAKQIILSSTETRYGELILETTPSRGTGSEQSVAIWLKEVLRVTLTRPLEVHNVVELLERLGTVSQQEGLRAWVERYDFVTRTAPDLALPSWDDLLASLFRELGQCSTLKDIKANDWSQALENGLPFEIRQSLSRRAPLSLRLKGGRQVAVHYEIGKDPWVESRLQDFFGMTETPRILDGRMPVTIHLLAPNKRAVQVTKDLKSFWEKGYQEIRNQLSRRYPRHAWPENPAQASPPAPR